MSQDVSIRRVHASGTARPVRRNDRRVDTTHFSGPAWLDMAAWPLTIGMPASGCVIVPIDVVTVHRDATVAETPIVAVAIAAPLDAFALLVIGARIAGIPHTLVAIASRSRLRSRNRHC